MKLDSADFTSIAALFGSVIAQGAGVDGSAGTSGNAVISFNQELELVYAPPAGAAPLDRYHVVRIVEYMRGYCEHMSYRVHDVRDSLDINIKDPFSTGLSSCMYRYSIPFTSESDLNTKLERFYSDGDMKSLGPGTELVKKCRLSQPVVVRNYKFRVNHKSETQLATGEGLTESSHRSYRLKRRYSFDLSPRFRLDVTAVRAINGGTSSRVTHSHMLSLPETYEMEIEFVPSADEGAMGARPEDHAKEMLALYSIVLKIVDDTEIGISMDEKARVVKEYTDLVHSNAFIGPKPVTLEMGNFLSQPPLSDMISIRNGDYTVTDKADGERRFLFCDSSSSLYLIDDRLNVHKLSIRVVEPQSGGSEQSGSEKSGSEKSGSEKSASYRLSILDGEFVSDSMYIFDTYFCDGRDVRDLPLTAPDGGGEGRTRLGIAKAFADSVKSPRISVKEFYMLSDDETFFSGVKAVFSKRDAKLYPYELDGAIFTPASMSARNLSGKVFKWKSPEQSTIDFMVVFHKDIVAGEGGSRMYVPVDLMVGFNTSMSRDTIHAMTYLNGTAFNEGRRVASHNQSRYEAKKFSFKNGNDDTLHLAHLPVDTETDLPKCENGDAINNNSIVEFSYAGVGGGSKHDPRNWRPLRVRHDKNEQMRIRNTITANNYVSAMNVWRTIVNPVSEETITGVAHLDEADVRAQLLSSVYYAAKLRSNEGLSVPMRRFHNWVKGVLIERFCRLVSAKKLFDIGTGKAGDLQKWIDARVAVVGIDKYESNITDGENGAYARVLERSMSNHDVPLVAFIPFDASKLFNSDSVDDMDNTTGNRTIASILLGNVPKSSISNTNLSKYHGMAAPGTFDICTCMFAIHYFFDREEHLDALCQNVSNALKKGGVFIGCSLDGGRVLELLDERAPNVGDAVDGTVDDSIIWKITRKFESTATSQFGLQIGVYMESIGQDFPEFLMMYTTLVSCMKKVGMVPLSDAALSSLNLGSFSTGWFKDMYDEAATASKRADVISQMTDQEHAYSTLNRWFAFTKTSAPRKK